MVRYKSLIINILIALGAGALSGIISRASMEQYSQLQTPVFSPPGIVFPIVWTILYILMGISAYMIFTAESDGKCMALTVYGIQLAFNFLWSIIFFNFGAYGFAFAWLIVLWALIVVMIFLFYQIKPCAAYLQVPYLFWVTFAGILNYAIVKLN